MLIDDDLILVAQIKRDTFKWDKSKYSLVPFKMTCLYYFILKLVILNWTQIERSMLVNHELFFFLFCCNF